MMTVFQDFFPRSMSIGTMPPQQWTVLQPPSDALPTLDSLKNNKNNKKENNNGRTAETIIPCMINPTVHCVNPWA